MSRTFDHEKYEQAITAEARAQHAVIMASLKAGAPQNVAVITRAVEEYLIDTNAVADLVTKTVAGGNPLQQVITDLVWTEAEQRAEAEMARRERAARAEIDDERISRAYHRMYA